MEIDFRELQQEGSIHLKQAKAVIALAKEVLEKTAQKMSFIMENMHLYIKLHSPRKKKALGNVSDNLSL